MNPLIGKLVAVAIIGAQTICAAPALAGQAQLVAPTAKPRPSAQELVAQYVQAAGVTTLRSNVPTRSCTGEVERTPSGTTAGDAVAPLKASLELDWKEPGRAREVWTSATSKLKRISDGEHGWEVGTGISRHELHPQERVELSRLAALYQPALVLPLDELKYVRTDKVGERAAYVLTTKLGEAIGELLWLDQETKLPLRVDLLVERPEASRAGEFYLTQAFFEDWQPAPLALSTAKNMAPVSLQPIVLPRKIRRVLAQATLIYSFNELKQGQDLSSSLFKIPYFWRK